MQFKTIREPKRGAERFARQTGPRGFYFAFDYQLSHRPEAESVEVRIDPLMAYEMEEFWPYIQAGVRDGCREAERQGVRLCCTRLFIPLTKGHAVDTSPELARARLLEFIQYHVVAWASPIDPLRAEWLTSDVIARARGIHADAAHHRYPILSDALQDAGCEDQLVHDHLQMCPDHGPSCWVVEMILDQTQAAGESSPAAR